MRRTKFKDNTPTTWARKLLAQEIVIWDTETTGVGHSARICSIGIISGRGEVLLDTLINPEQPIPPDATAVHGITDDRVADAPTFRRAFVSIYRALHNQTWVIYNAQYDTARLSYECARNRLRSPLPYPAPQCAMIQYARYYGERDYRHGDYRWQKLTDAVRQQGIEIVDAHNALGDALMTLALIQRMAADDEA